MQRAAVAFALTSTMWSCGHSSPRPADRPARPATAAGEPFLTGILLGHDRNPMKLAHVSIGKNATEVAADGSFHIPIDVPGFYEVAFTGVDHGDYTLGLWVEDEPIHVDVALGTYARPKEIESPQVVELHFNGSGEASLSKTFPLEKQADGSFAAEIRRKPGEFAYEIRGIGDSPGRSMNGTDETDYRYDRDGNYANVVNTSEGVVVVKLDPKQLAPAGVATSVSFAEPKSHAARIAEIYADMTARQKQIRDAAVRARAAGESSVELDSSWQAQLARSAETEKDDVVRHALLVAYFASWTAGEDQPSRETAALAERALDEIPADSPIWAMSATSAFTMAQATGDIPGQAEKVEAVILALRDEDTAAYLLLGLLAWASEQGRAEDAGRYFALMKKRFGGSPYFRMASMFDPSRSIRLGQPIPDFDLVSFDDAKTHFTRDLLRGKVVLIEFWATWCAPCIQEMPNLHAAYEKYRDRGFDILSIGTDDSPDSFREFRKQRFPMPWKNAVLGEDNTQSMKQLFEVSGLPTQILIDRQGSIVATGLSLRGPGLEAAVERALAADEPSKSD